MAKEHSIIFWGGQDHHVAMHRRCSCAELHHIFISTNSPAILLNYFPQHFIKSLDIWSFLAYLNFAMWSIMIAFLFLFLWPNERLFPRTFHRLPGKRGPKAGSAHQKSKWAAQNANEADGWLEFKANEMSVELKENLSKVHFTIFFQPCSLRLTESCVCL